MKKDNARTKVQLSVVVPVYNAEAYIRECVESILKQDYISLEVILVNDGSTDRSGDFCDQLAEEYACVKVLHITHGSSSKARLEGVRISTSEWITFADADDWIERNAYKDLLEHEDCEVIMTGICRYFSQDRQEMQMPDIREGMYNKEQILKEIVPVMLWDSRQMRWALDPSLCTKIFQRRVVLQELERTSELGSQYGDDSSVIFPMMFQVNRIRVVRKIYYYHRQREAGIIPQYIQDEDFITKLGAVYGYLKDRFQEAAYWDVMKGQLDHFFIHAVEMKKRCYGYPVLEYAACFPTDQISPRSRVVLYGAGKLGRQYWEQNILYCFCYFVLWVDTNYGSCSSVGGAAIENPERIRGLDFDYVLVAVDNYHVAKEIARYLDGLGVAKEKIIWQSARVCRKEF